MYNESTTMGTKITHDESSNGVLLEQIIHQNQIVLENLTDMQKKMNELATRTELSEVKADTETIKKALADTSRQIYSHEKRITKLEHQAI